MSACGTARTIASMTGEAWRIRSEWTTRGWPPIERNCLGTEPPMRSPRPAAGTSATTRLATCDLQLLSLGLFLQAGEDHAAGCGLEHAGDHHIDVLADIAPGIVHDDHRAVVEVGHALARFLSFFQHEDTDGFAGQHDRTQGIAEFVDIEHTDTLQ